MYVLYMATLCYNQFKIKEMEQPMNLLDSLNEQQREAVQTTEGPLLILAGAGSGKTRVLTHRTAYLIDEMGVNPYNIMAITFTNKAAGEMRERIDAMVGYGSESIWVSTFHSTCVRILRRYIDRLGYSTNFTIYDADDQKTLMKDICKRLEIDTKLYKERMFLSVISSAKDELVEAQTEILRKDSDMEVIRNVQEKVNAVMGKEKPNRKDAPASGDSASRIARLNGVSDGDGS